MKDYSCPMPLPQHDTITMAHGGGGRAMQRLLETVFYPVFDNPWLGQRHDAALLAPHAGRLAFTTDSFVVQPLFFPGGDIGSLAVYGTANDLAMTGARPAYLSVAFVLEEGLPVETLRRVVQSMRASADEVGLAVVTGDTKVIEGAARGQLFVNTSGVGLVEHNRLVGPHAVGAGDVVLVSGDVGRHGASLLTVRQELGFASTLVSDCGHCWPAVAALLEAGAGVHALRDCTRGGLGAALVELAEAGGVTVHLEEEAVPVEAGVRGVCEILGLDPLFMPCEGRFVVFVAPDDAEEALEVLRLHKPAGASDPARIGTVEAGEGRVLRIGPLGARRVLDVPNGEQLPRIC